MAHIQYLGSEKSSEAQIVFNFRHSLHNNLLKLLGLVNTQEIFGSLLNIEDNLEDNLRNHDQGPITFSDLQNLLR